MTTRKPPAPKRPKRAQTPRSTCHKIATLDNELDYLIRRVQELSGVVDGLLSRRTSAWETYFYELPNRATTHSSAGAVDARTSDRPVAPSRLHQVIGKIKSAAARAAKGAR